MKRREKGSARARANKKWNQKNNESPKKATREPFGLYTDEEWDNSTESVSEARAKWRR